MEQNTPEKEPEIPVPPPPPDAPLETVPAWYFMAFHYRMLGMQFKQIGEQLGHHEDTVKKLFGGKGKLKELWDEFRNETAKANAEEAMTIILGHLPDVARAMVLEAREKGMVATINRKMVFDLSKLAQSSPAANPESVKDIMDLLHDASEEAGPENPQVVASGPDAPLPEVVAEVRAVGQADGDNPSSP